MISLLKNVFGEKNTSAPVSFEDAFRGAMDHCADENTAQEKAMLEGVLDLSEITVYDIMNHRKNLFSIDIDLPVAEIFAKVENSPFSRVPLYQDRPENIVGVIRVKTLFKEIIDHAGVCEQVDIRKIMTEPWFIPDNTTLLQQLQLFRSRREHFAIVVDEYGVLQGVVTLEDILEEIVGEIDDESDAAYPNPAGIRKINERTFVVDGQVSVRDLNRRFGWNICDSNAATIAGYLLDMTQSIPSAGQKFMFEGFHFEILKRKKNQICLVKISY